MSLKTLMRDYNSPEVLYSINYFATGSKHSLRPEENYDLIKIDKFNGFYQLHGNLVRFFIDP